MFILNPFHKKMLYYPSQTPKNFAPAALCGALPHTLPAAFGLWGRVATLVTVIARPPYGGFSTLLMMGSRLL